MLHLVLVIFQRIIDSMHVAHVYQYMSGVSSFIQGYSHPDKLKKFLIPMLCEVCCQLDCQYERKLSCQPILWFTNIIHVINFVPGVHVTDSRPCITLRWLNVDHLTFFSILFCLNIGKNLGKSFFLKIRFLSIIWTMLNEVTF